MRIPSPFIRVAGAALLASLIAPFAAHAESFTSSASSAGSASLGSSSDSIKGSSNSSSGDNKVADGDYQVLEVTALADRPGMLRLRLQQPRLAAGGVDAGAFTLVLPEKALGARGVAAGELVSVRNREYGVEFARAQTHEAFFLVLNDDWHNELDPRPVTAF
jgi:hypothetical protein